MRRLLVIGLIACCLAAPIELGAQDGPAEEIGRANAAVVQLYGAGAYVNVVPRPLPQRRPYSWARRAAGAVM